MAEGGIKNEVDDGEEAEKKGEEADDDADEEQKDADDEKGDEFIDNEEEEEEEELNKADEFPLLLRMGAEECSADWECIFVAIFFLVIDSCSP